MPLTRQQKEQRVATMIETISRATSVVFMSFDELTVDAAETLRDKLFVDGSQMQVIPKRLLRLVLKQLKLEQLDPVAQAGQVAVIWGSDAVAPAKALYEFTKEHENVRLLAGVLEDGFLSLSEVTSLAQLPSRQQLLGQLLSVLVGPLRGFQGVLSGVQRQMVYVLTAIADQKK